MIAPSQGIFPYEGRRTVGPLPAILFDLSGFEANDGDLALGQSPIKLNSLAGRGNMIANKNLGALQVIGENDKFAVSLAASSACHFDKPAY